MKDKGIAHIGIGEGKGDDKAMEAVKMAVESPLLETTISGATHVIIIFPATLPWQMLPMRQAMFRSWQETM